MDENLDELYKRLDKCLSDFNTGISTYYKKGDKRPWANILNDIAKIWDKLGEVEK